MAIKWSVAINKVTVFGDERVVYATLTSPASGSDTYTTGGDIITPAQVGLAYIDFANCNVAYPTGGATAYLVNIVPGVGENANALVQLFTAATSTGPTDPLAEAQGSTVASYSFNVQFFGV